MSNKLMRSKGEGGEEGGRGGVVVQISADDIMRQVIETEVMSHKSQVVFKLECHHHSWSHF